MQLTLEEYLRITPDAPRFDATQPTWCPLAAVQGMLGLSDSGLAKVRKRLHNAYEHREANRVFIYCPFWFRAYAIEKCDRASEADFCDYVPAFMAVS
jgi:hypothetical protein